MQIVSYNVNGIRAAARKGLVPWLAENDFDIVCLQEAKAMLEQVDMSEFEALGYHHHWHSAEKKGYSGVVTLSKQVPIKVAAGCALDTYDREGRILRTDFDDLTVLNCYFPSGTTGDVRQDFKMQFLADFQQWVEELRKERPNLIIVGDYNIAHHPIDIHDPVRNKNSSGFLPGERAWLSDWFENGFTDAFRKMKPEEVAYSWWSYRANARANNKGWRIDYQSVSDHLADKIKDVYHCKDIVHSDHCALVMEIEI